jgi:hypothetical protein
LSYLIYEFRKLKQDFWRSTLVIAGGEFRGEETTGRIQERGFRNQNIGVFCSEDPAAASLCEALPNSFRESPGIPPQIPRPPPPPLFVLF